MTDTEKLHHFAWRSKIAVNRVSTIRDSDAPQHFKLILPPIGAVGPTIIAVMMQIFGAMMPLTRLCMRQHDDDRQLALDRCKAPKIEAISLYDRLAGNWPSSVH